MSKKRILITGKGSYVGTNFINWLVQWPEQYEVEELSVRGEEWKKKDFSPYDAILHVAGIAHVSTNPKMEDLYYKVNRDLTLEVAKKAKSQGVAQFIFMSSIIVYGDSSRDIRVIDRHTIPKPSNFYGNSKLQAEEGLKKLKSDDFIIAIIRSPMVYGKDSKGNYSKLARAVQLLPIFPDIDNQRSMLHIDNLSEFIKLLIDHKENGFFFPQNREYVKTSQLVKVIAEVHGKQIKLSKVFNIPLRFLIHKVGLVNKVFGNLIYDTAISQYRFNYQVRNLRESIIISEKRDESFRKSK